MHACVCVCVAFLQLGIMSRMYVDLWTNAIRYQNDEYTFKKEKQNTLNKTIARENDKQIIS